MPTEHPLETRVRLHLAGLGVGEKPARVQVALSGGVDSVVLLHLLRFRLPSLQIEPVAAHLDHALRPDSSADAYWVRGLCTAWRVELRTERLSRTPRGEAAARTARYEFLRRTASQAGAELIATAHHADDQAETVLFRALRGTGLKGLAGIAPRAGDLLRPLLPLWRREIEAYARERGLAWRTDASNLTLDPVRNRLRHEVLPLLEQRISPSARRSLVSLAALAGEAEAALERMASAAENDLVEWDDGVCSLARRRLPVYDSAVTTRVLRNLLRHFGVVLGRTGTRRALQFITDAPSGRRMPLSGNLQVEIEFDRAVFRPAPDGPPDDRIHEIADAATPGEARIRIGGAEYTLRYGVEAAPLAGPAEDGRWVFRASVATVAFPLLVRGWRDGDRLHTGHSRRKLKRVFLEQRIPRERRRRLPLIVDAEGEVIWVAGLAPGAVATGREGGESFILRVLHD